MGSRRERHDVIDVVEAVYDLGESLDEGAWLTKVLEKLRPQLDHGLGVCCYLSDASHPFREVAGLGVPESWNDAMLAVMTSSAGPTLMAPPRPASTASDGVGRDELARNDAMRRAWHPLGVFDGIGITANDGTGQLVTFVAPLPSVMSLSPRATARYERVAAHVAAGWRLRRALARHEAAVLTPAGKLLHAEGDARERSAREQLRDAAVAIDRARGALRADDGDAALRAWRVLVRGEWSLVDRFERDGRRYLVALENAPDLRDPRALESRERQVLALTALGHSLKLIAYELGLSPSSVCEVRKRAMRKLGVASLAELSHLLRARPPGAS